MWKLEDEKIIDSDRDLEVLIWPIHECRITYKESGREIDFFLDMAATSLEDGPGFIVLGPHPIRWNDGEVVPKEKASLIRQDLLEAVQVEGFNWIVFSKKADSLPTPS